MFTRVIRGCYSEAEAQKYVQNEAQKTASSLPIKR